MGSYWVPIADILANAGCRVSVDGSNAGWENRSRSSGGFDGAPLGVQWHHTASSASVDSDLSYMINGSPDEPVGNVLLDRDGIFHPIAAGAANTSGKGGPNGFSRGTVPKDSGNTRLFSIEIANNGVGETYTQAQIDAAFRGSNALNAHFGNQPDDVVTHSLGAGDGYTDRKIDPATTNVQGPWQPNAVNSSGTWGQAGLRNECLRRVGTLPPPTPVPTEGVITMWTLILNRFGFPGPVIFTVAADGIRWNNTGLTDALDRLVGVPSLELSEDQMVELLIDRPGIGANPFNGAAPGYEDPELANAWGPG